MSSNIESESLLHRACQGDREALARLLFAQYQDLEQFVARRIPRSKQQVLSPEDVLQDTFAQVFRDISTYSVHDGSSFYSWVKTIADHRVKDAMKRANRKKRGGDMQQVGRPASGGETSVADLLDQLSDVSRTPSQKIARREAVSALQVALAKLPEDYREAIRLRYLERKSIQEVAVEMGRTEGAVRGLIDRAKRKLCVDLGPESAFLTVK